MKYGFEDGKFYLEITSKTRPVGNLREECELRAREIAATSSKIMVSFSGGIDSQCMLHSFYTQNIPIETVLMYLPGYNDVEYKQVQALDKKYGMRTHIIDINPLDYQDEFARQAIELDMPNKNTLLQRKFLTLVPDDYDFIQNQGPDPLVYINPFHGQSSYFNGYYSDNIGRDRIFKTVNRKGKVIFWGESDEYLLTTLNDDVHRAAIDSAKYFDENGATVPGRNLKVHDRWDYYIKPLVIGKYWKKELTYYPKFSGFENIEFIKEKIGLKARHHAVVIPYYKLIEFLDTESGITRRFYENHNPNTKVGE
jgi:hypothetical protein